MTLRHTVSERDRGRTVYSILRTELRLSATLIRRLKVTGGIAVSGAPAYTNRPVAPGETVEADVTAGEPKTDAPPEHGDLTILYETEGLIAVHKPPGMLTHPSRARYTGTLANFVAGYLSDQGAHPLCHAVNRLDRDTSGVILFAKNGYMKTLAVTALERGEKDYLALAMGEIKPASGVIDMPIRRVTEGDMLRAVLPDGQRAVTRYETLYTSAGGAASLLRLRLETGRTHQIRVHLHALGHPVLGDGLYSTAESQALSDALDVRTCALHAGRLAFCDPLTGKAVELFAKSPWWADSIHT